MLRRQISLLVLSDALDIRSNRERRVTRIQPSPSISGHTETQVGQWRQAYDPHHCRHRLQNRLHRARNFTLNSIKPKLLGKPSYHTYQRGRTSKTIQKKRRPKLLLSPLPRSIIVAFVSLQRRLTRRVASESWC